MNNNQTTQQLKISCPDCEQKLDVTNVPAFSEVMCPRCQCGIVVPCRFSHYLLERPIEEKDDSSVYQATDLKLDRQVAIKIFSTELSGMPECTSRLIMQTKRIAIINHPNIVPIFSNGEHQGRYYIAMEYLSQHSLHQKVQSEHPLRVPTCLHYTIQAARGLAAAHRKAMTHGGLNPRNLLLDADDNIKISDFGMWQIKPEARKAPTLPDPRYSSPEIIYTGKGDCRSDIFSLGSCLYYALTGHPPLAKNWYEQIPADDQENYALPLLAGEPIEERPDISEELNSYVLQLLAPLPEERPASYEQVLSALEKMRRQEVRVKKTGSRLICSRSGKENITGMENGKNKACSNSFIQVKYRNLKRRRRIFQIISLFLLAIFAGGVLLLIKERQQHTNWYQKRVSHLEKRLVEGLFSRPRIVIKEEQNNNSDDRPVSLSEKIDNAEPALKIEETEEEEEVKDERLSGNGQGTPRFQDRPRPPGLDFQSARYELQAYLQNQSEDLRELEQSRVLKLSHMLDYLRQLMRTPFDSGENGILLTSGRRIHGVIPFCNEHELTIRLHHPPGTVRTLKWQDLAFEQYLDFFQYYINRRMMMTDTPQNELLDLDPVRDTAEDYFRMALLADWYGHYNKAAKYAAEALKLDPQLEQEIDRFFFYLKVKR